MKSILFRTAVFLVLLTFIMTGCKNSGSNGPSSPALSSLAITPVNPIVSLNATRQFTATGTYSDGTTRDITASATWSSLDSTIATVSDASGTKGLATPLAAGTTTITATLQDKKASATISVISTGGSASAEINFHQMAVGRPFGDIEKLFNPVIDDANRRLYVVGSKTTNVGVVDLNTDELIETFDIGVPGGFLIFNSNTLYSYDFSVGKCYQIDTTNKTASEVSTTVCEAVLPHDKGQPKYWHNYSFLETGYQSFPDGTTGFPTDWRQDLHGAYGVIEIYDSSNVKKGEIIHGPDALYFTIDQTTGKLYTTNSGDGSIQIFDLNKLESTNFCQDNACFVKYVDIGNSADEVVADSSGTIYVRNRLCGSVIYKYDPTAEALSIIDNLDHVPGGISLWPTGIALSSDEKKLFVLSHYDALIDVVDTATDRVVSKITFTTDLKPRTDSISALKMDKSRNRLYAVWPELGVIGVADGNNNSVVGTIDMTLYGFDRSKAANRGPGLVTLEVSEKNNKLYAYLKNEQTTLVFNGDTLAYEGQSSLGMFKVNDDKNVFYVGSEIVDAATNTVLGSFSKGQSVIAFNNSANAVYLYAMQSATGGKHQEKVYEFVNNAFTREWDLDEIGSIPSNFYFDFKNHVFYVAYFESGIVKTYSL